MREEYLKELEELKLRMEDAENFAEKLPFFSKTILNDKLTGNEEWIIFGNEYKDIYLGWYINRGLYSKGSRREVTNFSGKSYTKFLFNIYVNTYSLFNHHAIRVDEVANNVDVFFYDKLNSTFYATDEQIEPLLDALNDWYKKAKEENRKLLAEKRKKEATDKLKEAQEEIDRLSHS